MKILAKVGAAVVIGALVIPAVGRAQDDKGRAAQGKTAAQRAVPVGSAASGAQPGANLNQPGQCDTRSGAETLNPACKGPKVNDAFGGGHGPGAAGGQLTKGRGEAIKDPPQAESKLPTGQTPAQKAAEHKMMPEGHVPGEDGKLVHPGDFSREAELKGLMDPNSALVEGMKRLPGAGSTDTPFPGQVSAGDLLKNAGAIPGPGSFKNSVSKQDEQGEGYTEKQFKRGDPDAKPVDKNNEYHGRSYTYRTSSGGEGIIAFDKGGAKREVHYVKDVDTFVTVKWDKNGREIGRIEERGTVKITREPIDPKKTTPNPETDTGDGHGPKNLLGDNPPAKTPAELAAERKRQVTLPGDGQTERVRVHADPVEAAQYGIQQRGAGRTDPDDRSNDGTTTGLGTGTPTLLPGHGRERVDGKRGGGVPDQTGFAGHDIHVPSQPGSSPDNPTATNGNQSTTESNPADPKHPQGN